MAIFYCHVCDKIVDIDYDVEHLEYCEAADGTLTAICSKHPGFENEGCEKCVEEKDFDYLKYDEDLPF